MLYPLIFVVIGLLLSLLAQSFVALLIFLPIYLLVVLIFFCFYPQRIKNHFLLTTITEKKTKKIKKSLVVF